MKTELCPVTAGDLPQIEAMLARSIADLYRKNSIRPEDPAGELRSQMKKVEMQIHATHPEYYFLAAKSEGRIVGVAGCFPVGPTTRGVLPPRKDADREIGCIYVDPASQKSGIGWMLFEAIRRMLKDVGAETFILCADMPSSQAYWKHKLGEPDYFFPNLWGEGIHEMVWRKKR